MGSVHQRPSKGPPDFIRDSVRAGWRWSSLGAEIEPIAQWAESWAGELGAGLTLDANNGRCPAHRVENDDFEVARIFCHQHIAIRGHQQVVRLGQRGLG